MTALPPIIAILRGVQPDEVVEVADVLAAAGIRAIEVPLNSPDALESIRRLVAAYGETCLCGAGTVTDVAQVIAVCNTGAQIIVSPNANPEVIQETMKRNVVALPGIFTPTEAFAALQAGAAALKLFPASTGGVTHLQNLRDVLPPATPIFAVGGVNADNAAIWRQAGAAGIGIGGGIYKPGRSLTEISGHAAAIVKAWG